MTRTRGNRHRGRSVERKNHHDKELASTTEIDKYGFFAAEFFEKILDMKRKECLITDESSLWDFHGEMSNDPFYSKILEEYGVDASDIADGNLQKILQRIAEANRG